MVDVDGDGRLDMVFTRRTGGVTYWRNTGAAENRFVQQTLPGVSRPAYATLEGIVRHHLDPAAAVAAYDPAQLGPGVNTAHWAGNTGRALAKLAEDRSAGRTPLQEVALSDGQVADLVSFLHALTDPCVLDPACLAPWIPGEGDRDPDGLRVRGPEVSQPMENSE